MMCAALLQTEDVRDHGHYVQGACRTESVSTGCAAATKSSPRRGRCRHPRLMLYVMAVTVGSQHLSLHHRSQRLLFRQQGAGQLNGSYSGGAGHIVSGYEGQTHQEWWTSLREILPWTMWWAGLGPGGGGGGATTEHRPQCSLPLKPNRRSGTLTARSGDCTAAGKARTRCRAPPPISKSVQDLRIGGRMGNAQYQYTLQGDNFSELSAWAHIINSNCAHCPNWPMSTVITGQGTPGLAGN